MLAIVNPRLGTQVLVILFFIVLRFKIVSN